MTSRTIRRPSSAAMFLAQWVAADEPSRLHGQVFSGERGLVYALAGLRLGALDGTMLWGSLTYRSGGEPIFDSRAGLDVGPRCGVCPDGVCRDAGVHVLNHWMRVRRDGGAVQAACVCGWAGSALVGEYRLHRDEFRSHTCLEGGEGRG